MLWLLACPPPATPGDTGAVVGETGGEDSVVDTSWPDDSDSAEETGEPVIDLDEDGFPREEDCDDGDASINPDAEEVFDGFDNDCDGVIDASGSYSGSFGIAARGWFEGDPHDLAYDCPMEMERELISADWVVTCTIPSGDEWGRLLLGETLTLIPEDPYLWELDRWDGDVIVTSSDGWDTYGTGSLSWNTMEKATLVVGLDTTWLDFTGSGKLKR
ncbi:MAG TPA: putative metal-binding motif-containing protein [Myxococcota bacterium]|nr:putative metal-binding motif-containing protein [Myxococcota bacterium]